MDAPQIIKALGGTTEVARLLKLGTYGPQRVSNWIKRGIPLWVQLEHGALLRRAEAIATGKVERRETPGRRGADQKSG